MTEKIKTVGVIPARWESSRFPGKPLSSLGGKPMILWVAEAASRAESVEEVVVATDDLRIKEVVESAGYRAEMTSTEHATGSDRIAEVVAGTDWDLVVNIQGDEPLIDPEDIDRAVNGLKAHPETVVSTLKAPIRSREELADSNVVKVVTDSTGQALYFSRSPIPFDRDKEEKAGGGTEGYFRHLGLYVFRRPFLLEFTKMAATFLEQKEKLEQLRILESGYSILVLETQNVSPGVDCPEDLARLESLIADRE